ncbi:hypothetical protein LIA77_01354 [Sarocladium implicatum]|nr:hypothetical protein LIA77_01354 [Sarocladium implicatum]
MSVTETPVRVTTLRGSKTPSSPATPRAQRPTQKPFTLTLTGPALSVAATGIAICLHQETINVARAVLLITPLILFVHNDYLNFLRLGPGGIPSTPAGYLKMAFLRTAALKNPFEPPPRAPYYDQAPGILSKASLPKRQDARPATAGIAPHRQITQYGATECFQTLQQTLQRLAVAYPSDFEIKKSCLEKNGMALFAKRPAGERQGRFDGEICHVHDSDHSLHLFLHPDDIKEVLEKGWGERHPMAWEWGPWKPVVGPFFVMIYAPRDEQELRTVARIIEAAIWNSTGKETQLTPFL